MSISASQNIPHAAESSHLYIYFIAMLITFDVVLIRFFVIDGNIRRVH